jgi:CRP-like cAMP-binding protein
LGEFEKMRLRSVAFGPRSLLLREGDTPSEIFTLFEGWAYRFKLFPDGRRQIIRFLLPGDFVVLRGMQTQPLAFSVQALTAVRLCAFDATSFSRIVLSRPKLIERLVRAFSDELSELDLRLTEVGRCSASERIARFILKIESRAIDRNLATADGFPFPLRQEHIADALGLTVVHVSRTLIAFRNAGLMTLRRGSMTIRDRAMLEETARTAGVYLYR